jgi:hypothetical protein
MIMKKIFLGTILNFFKNWNQRQDEETFEYLCHHNLMGSII